MILACLFVLQGLGWIWPAIYRIPIFGPLMRWSHLSQFSKMMGMLIEERVSLPDALRLSATAICHGNLAKQCCAAADEVEKGRPISEVLAASRWFSAAAVPLIQWGEKTPAMAESFRAVGEMFEGRVHSQNTFLETFLLPIMLLIITAFTGTFIVGMLLPLLELFKHIF